MQIKNVLTGLVGLAVLADAASIDRRSPFGRTLERRRGGGNQGNQGGNAGAKANAGGNANNAGTGNNAGGSGESLTLDSNLVQTGSQQNGNNPGGDGQAASVTDNANFNNFCSGKTLTNGEQVKTGSCNGIPMGNIPSVNNMVSTVFVNPQDGDTIPSNTTFNIQVQMLNFAPGTFTNATSTYYSAPQDVDGSGNIIGHTHVTVQTTGNSLNPTQPLDPQQFVFFKGINDAGNGQGLLSANVTDGLPAGNYRVCSMSAAANHQPVLMPVAQRGAQDDCVRFTVSNSGNAGNNGNGNTSTNNAGTGSANNAGTGNANNGQTGQNNGQGSSTNNAGTGSTNNAGTGNDQTGQANNGTATATGQNGQSGQNNGQTGQTGQAGQGQAGQGAKGGHRGGHKGGKGGKGANGAQPAKVATSVAAGGAAAATASPAAAATSAAVVSNASTGSKGGASAASALGGIAAPPVTNSGSQDRPFEVQGNTFTTKAAAEQRACDVQNNLCATAVNSKKLSGVSVGECNSQITTCVAALAASS